MKRLRKINNQDGLTLIEVMVSLLIVSISILAVYIMLINGLDLINEQEHRKVVSELARNRLEVCQYAALLFDTVPRNLGGSYQDTVVYPNDDQDGIYANCRVVVNHSMEININTGKPYYSEVDIYYDWIELSEAENSMEFHVVY